MSKRGHHPCKTCCDPSAKEISLALLDNLAANLKKSQETFENQIAAMDRVTGSPAVKPRPPSGPELLTRRQRQALRGTTMHKPKNTLDSIARKYGISKPALLRHRKHLLRALVSELKGLEPRMSEILDRVR